MSDGKDLSVMQQALEWAYEKATSGGGVLGSSTDLAEEYLRDNGGNALESCNSLIRWQNAKAATSGFVTNIGGIATLPVAIPANIASSLIIQLRMVSAIAHIGGHDIFDDKVKTLCYVCLAGNSGGEILKEVGVQFGMRYSKAMIEKYITREVINAINKAVGFRLVTKAGTSGLVNFTKLIPVLGGVIGGTFDGVVTNSIGNFARDTFVGVNEKIS